MGYSVGVYEYVAFAAVCSETHCGWREEATSRHDAERRVDEHVRGHSAAWQRLGDEWERPDEVRDRLACPACGGPVALLDYGLVAGMYRCLVHGPLTFEQGVLRDEPWRSGVRS